MFTESDTLIGLCVGTTKIAVIVAERDFNPRRETVQIIGIGSAPSQGIRKGSIVNLDAATQSVRKAVREAENIVGFKLTRAMVSFNAVGVSSVMSSGMVSLALGRGPRPVQVEDVERVIEAAQSELALPTNKVVALHTIPVRYFIDSSADIDDPMGMTGMRLAMNLQTVTVPKPDVHNVMNCVRSAGIEKVGLVIKPITSALGALTEEEMRRGAISLSLGGGTTGLAFYRDGRPIKVGIVPIGGDHITNDLASVLRLPLSEAEDLKKRIFSKEDDDFPVLGAKGQQRKAIDPEVALDVISARLEELFTEHVAAMIPEHDPKQFPAGIVLSGGVARTPDLDVLLSDIFKMPVRVADPTDYYQMPPGRDQADYISAIGTIRYILNKERNPFKFIDEPIVDTFRGGGGSISEGPPPDREKPRSFPLWRYLKKIAERIKESFKELF